MKTVLAQLLPGAMVGLSVALLFKYIIKSSSREVKVKEDGWHRMVIARGLIGSLYMGLIFFPGVIVFSSLFPGKTQTLWPIHLIFLLATILTAITLYLVRKSRFQWNDEVLIGRSKWGFKERQMRWDEVKKVSYHPALQSLELDGSGAGPVYFPALGYSGVLDLLRELERRKESIVLVGLEWGALDAMLLGER